MCKHSWSDTLLKYPESFKVSSMENEMLQRVVSKIIIGNFEHDWTRELSAENTHVGEKQS